MEITSRDIVTPEQKLLYSMLLELKEINLKLTSKEEMKLKTTVCKYCGEIHENKGQMLACARKHKKEGAK